MRILSSRITSPNCKKWYVASKASNGRVFTALGKTEPTSRRAAGLRTFEYLKSRAEGSFEGLTEEEIDAARLELADALSEMARLVIGFNESFPDSYSKDVILIELRTGRELVLEKAERGVLARWIAPPLLFLAGAFSEGVIGYGAEKALEALAKLLSS